MKRHISMTFVEDLRRAGADPIVVEAAMRSTRRAELGDVWPQDSVWRKQWSR